MLTRSVSDSYPPVSPLLIEDKSIPVFAFTTSMIYQKIWRARLKNIIAGQASRLSCYTIFITREYAFALPALKKQWREDNGHHGHDLYQDVHAGAGGILEGVAYRVSYNRGFMGV